MPFFGDGFFVELSLGQVLVFADDVEISVFSRRVVHLLDGGKGMFHLEEITFFN